MGFERLRGLYEHVHVQTGALFSRECALAEDALAFCFASYGPVAGRKPDGKTSRMLALFHRNCVYLSAAYQLIRLGMLDPAGNNMRTVFETIVWQYAYLTDDSLYRESVGIEELETQKLALVKSGQWSNTRERRLENLRRKHGFQKAMRNLYSKEVYEKFFFNQYWALCQKSHTSIFGANLNTPTMEGATTLEKAPDEIRGSLSALLYLCAENLILFMNSFHALMVQGEIDAAISFTNRINRSIPPALGLAPDGKKLEFTLHYREV
ncbi:MAG: hypothetical protein AB1529_06560 [Candidatus Micrarchaeota archaeon]